MAVGDVAHEAHPDIGELVLPGHLDGVLDAHLLAQLARDAVLVDDHRHGLILGQRGVALEEVLHHEGLEGAHVDAELAAGAQLLVHHGPGDLLDLDALDGDVVLVVDGVEGAVDAADRAVDAQVGLDEVALAARDGVGRTDALADRAGGALLVDEVRLPLPAVHDGLVGEGQDLDQAVGVVVGLEADDVVRTVAAAFGLSQEDNKAVLLNRIEQFLLACHKQGKLRPERKR